MRHTKKLAILNLIVFIGTVSVNTLANLLPINNLTTGEISEIYPNLFVPAGITFSIWGLIYLLLGIFTFYGLMVAFKKRSGQITFVDKIGVWNVILGLANMLWIVFWHYLYPGITVIIILVMLFSLIIIYSRLEIGKGNSSLKEVLLVHINFSIYLGWISIATIANITAFLVSINWNGFGITPSIWTVIVMSVGVLLSLYFIYYNRDIFYALVANWAFFGIYLERTSEKVLPVPLVINWSIGSVVLLTFAIIFAILTKRIYTNNAKKKVVYFNALFL